MWRTSSGVLCPPLRAYTATKAVINGSVTGGTRRPGPCQARGRGWVRKKASAGEKHAQGIHFRPPEPSGWRLSFTRDVSQTL